MDGSDSRRERYSTPEWKIKAGSREIEIDEYFMEGPDWAGRGKEAVTPLLNRKRDKGAGRDYGRKRS